VVAYPPLRLGQFIEVSVLTRDTCRICYTSRGVAHPHPDRYQFRIDLICFGAGFIAGRNRVHQLRAIARRAPGAQERAEYFI
jgi:hypothetical protein